MTVTIEALERLDQHWTIQAIGIDNRTKGLELAELKLLREAVGNQFVSGPLIEEPVDFELLERLATAYEVAAIEGINSILYPNSTEQNEQLQAQAQAGAYRAFEIRRVLNIPNSDEEKVFHILHLAALAYCGDRSADLKRWINDYPSQILVQTEESWDRKILFEIYDCWIRLLRKDGWNDLNQIAQIISSLRLAQKDYEAKLLQQEQGLAARAIAFRLLALYHWARATELIASFMLQGQPVNITTEIDKHFETGTQAATASQDPAFEVLLRWLHVAARRMIANSVWTIAQSNPKFNDFIQNLTKNRSLFEFLPPQRAALLEQGLLDQASRAIVVDLPTSGGKTILAQFRILQALNQFDQLQGWVAYVAPTRALVSQITRRLRSDFEEIGVIVEQLNAAVEIDNVEEGMLSENSSTVSFHVLVTTPEKLSLVIRNKKIPRPLALVVMDEAQNLEDEDRGLRIELLLAIIKQDCQYANFLLLMPYVSNANDLARWLAPEASKTISLSTSAWQPNELIVGMFSPIREDGKRGDWSLQFETLITTRKTLYLKGNHKLGEIRPIDKSLSDVSGSLISQTAAAAKIFSDRGTSIAIARSIPDCWSLAKTLAKNLEEFREVPSDISLVQKFLATEISPSFELINLLSKGVGVHHSGLSEETRALVEWLTENGKLRVLCATTTIAQGINFPVSSVFLATRKLPVRESKDMPKRMFWNLAGRAGRIGQDSVGVVALAAGDQPNEIREYVSEATGDLISRLISLLDELESVNQLFLLSARISDNQWIAFRSYVAHLWNEKQDLGAVLQETEQLLRNTFGYTVLQSKGQEKDRKKAQALLDATKKYAQKISDKQASISLCDSTGFAPEGVEQAIDGMKRLEKKITATDWEPTSLFKTEGKSILPQLVGVMMRVPELQHFFEDEAYGFGGKSHKYISQVAQAWVSGKSIEEIALTYFSEKGSKELTTTAITEACKGIYRALANGGSWGLSSLIKMPNSGIKFEALTEEEKQQIENLPAMLYHGVSSEPAIIMRMNAVPRSIAEQLGSKFAEQYNSANKGEKVGLARQFLKSLTDNEWQNAVPSHASMSGIDYKRVWSTLSGNTPAS